MTKHAQRHNESDKESIGEDPLSAYSSPLSDRYATREMQVIWSPRRKFETWRDIWVAVAQTQHQLGLSVTAEQVEELRANIKLTDEDVLRAGEYEKKLRHDVMAHIHAWGDRCPRARGIIHLGMTSQDINDNCEVRLIRESVALICARSAALVCALGAFADRWKGEPTLGFTHYQPAQPTTVGRRAAQWAYDVSLALGRVSGLRDHDVLRYRGLKGATGTQASYLQLVDGSPERVAELDSGALSAFAGESGENVSHVLCAQTYPRVVDTFVLGDLASMASVLHKVATDIRLLSNRKELDEPFGSSQVGSSAMPYKRNPMRCERACALARFVMNLVGNGYDTAATQWLERTLDDSANRRLSLPEAFLALDGCLAIMCNVCSGLIVHGAQVRKNLLAELPFLATENLMMEAVKLGRDRQAVHEAIRTHSMEAGRRIKDEGAENDLLGRLAGEPLLAGVDLDGAMDPMHYVGLALQQVEMFLERVVQPTAQRYGITGDGDTPDDLRV